MINLESRDNILQKRMVLSFEFQISRIFFLLGYLITKVKSKAKIRYRYNQVPDLTRDTIKESDNHHTQESQEVSPLTVGDQKDARNSHDSKQ